MKTELNIRTDEQLRGEIAKGLTHFLADTYTLYLKTHNYHWNVTGPMFQMLHTMFEGHYTELAVATDDIAERIRALQFKAPATYREFMQLTSIKDGESNLSGTQMIETLIEDHKTVIKTAKGIFGLVADAHDEPTADLLVQRIRLHEKTVWMLRSILE
jgi:starvation-inducible DNA-binding protein